MKQLCLILALASAQEESEELPTSYLDQTFAQQQSAIETETLESIQQEPEVSEVEEGGPEPKSEPEVQVLEEEEIEFNSEGWALVKECAWDPLFVQGLEFLSDGTTLAISTGWYGYSKIMLGTMDWSSCTLNTTF